MYSLIIGVINYLNIFDSVLFCCFDDLFYYELFDEVYIVSVLKVCFGCVVIKGVFWKCFVGKVVGLSYVEVICVLDEVLKLVLIESKIFIIEKNISYVLLEWYSLVVCLNIKK